MTGTGTLAWTISRTLSLLRTVFPCAGSGASEGAGGGAGTDGGADAVAAGGDTAGWFLCAVHHHPPVPATAATYVLETILAKYLLREHVDWRRWTGATLVAGGVALLIL